jgi:hypothetical protein
VLVQVTGKLSASAGLGDKFSVFSPAHRQLCPARRSKNVTQPKRRIRAEVDAEKEIRLIRLLPYTIKRVVNALKSNNNIYTTNSVLIK